MQQLAAHAEGHIIRTQATGFHFLQNRFDGLGTDAVALNQAHAVRQHPVAFAVGAVAEAGHQAFDGFRDDLHRFAGIGTDHQGAAGLLYLLAQFATPQVVDGVPDVVGIADYRHHPVLPAELLDHVGVGPGFTVAPPAGNGAVLCRRDGETGHVGTVVTARGHDRGKGIGTGKVNQVCHTTKGSSFFRGGATGTEVVQFEGQAVAVVGGIFQVALDDGATVAGHRGHGGGIPDSAQQGSFHIAGEPGAVRVGVHDLHQHITGGHHGAFRHGFDFDGQVTVVVVENVIPARTVEGNAVRNTDRFGFFDIRFADRAAQVFLEEGLQTEEHGVAVATTTGFDIAGDILGTGRVLGEVRGLVGIGVENQVTHDGVPPVDCDWRRSFQHAGSDPLLGTDGSRRADEHILAIRH